MVPRAVRVGVEVIAAHEVAGGGILGAAGVGHKRRSSCVESTALHAAHLTRTPVTATKDTHDGYRLRRTATNRIRRCRRGLLG